MSANISLPVNYSSLSYSQKREVRNEYIKRQKGMCCHCLNPLDGDPAEGVRKKWLNKRLFPENFLTHPVHLHHCRKTGKTVGVVHAKCNGVLWQYYGE